MGTRADFYVLLPAHDDRPAEWEWLGSVGWDGYEWAEDKDRPIWQSATEAEYRQAVVDIMKDRDDASLPADGWPWPWNDSEGTDYVYFWADGRPWYLPEGYDSGNLPPWPDMSEGKRRSLFGPHSGLLVVTSGQ